MEAKLNLNIEYYAKPFVKWAGGKTQLLEDFEKYYPLQLQRGSIKRYIEPFVGGGAVLFDILQKYNISEAFIFDINEELINAYKAIKYCVDDLIGELDKLETKYISLDCSCRKEMYYEVRDSYNSINLKDNHIDIIKASYLVFLNRTCFNGLYRVNQAGAFNVPMGRYKNPKICDRKNLYAINCLLQKVNIYSGNYGESEKYIGKDSFVYFDPPYRPLSASSSFTTYSRFDFNDDEQIQLAKFFKTMDSTGAKLMLSNSDPKNVNPNDNFFEDHFSDFNIYRLKAKRIINSNGNGRGLISEILITNYK